MKKYLLIAVLLLCFQYGNTQNYKFGKVSKEELDEKEHPLESDANAAILYKNRTTAVEYSPATGLMVETDIHMRIKIYNKEGLDWATTKVPLYRNNSAKEKISGLKAYTYNIVDGKVEETKLKKDGIFTEELSKNVHLEKFTLPNVNVGSVIEYKYRVLSPFISNIDEFQLQYSIPVKKIETSFSTLEYFTYKKHYKGFHMIKAKEYKANHLKLDAYNGISEFNSENVPSLKEEPFVSNIRNYMTTIKFELAQTQLPGAMTKFYATDWQDVVSSIYKSPNFGGELKIKGYYKKDIDQLIAGVDSPMQKAGIVFNYIKNNIKWDGKYGYYARKGVRKAYKEKTGNVGDINLMLTAILRYVGVEANPVLVSTRQNGVPLFPSREGYDYVVTAIEVDGAVILLDATNYYGEPNVLPYRALNWRGRLVRKDGSFNLINLFPDKPSTVSDSFSVSLSEDGQVEGKRRCLYTNHDALYFRKRYIGADLDEYLEEKENNIENIEIDDYDVKNDKDTSKPVMESYSFVMENQVEKIGDKIYFSPLFFLAETENIFKAEERQYPIDFAFPRKRKTMLNIKFPEGYTAESLPEAVTMALPKGMGAYRFNISKSADGINVLVSRDINTAIIPQLYYADLKEYFKRIVDKETEKVVLTKI